MSTKIDISHTYDPYLNITGTAPGASKFYENSEVVNFIFPLTVKLGTMGLESNVGGLCDVDFSTQNNFKLLHTANNSSFGDYTLRYRNVAFSQANNPQLTMPCTSTATDLNFTINGFSLSGIDSFIDSGIYQDIVSVIVTTQ